MSEIKECKQCSHEFKVEDADLEFYRKISPTFDGKTFEIPAPTLCPNCRRQRRLSGRNVTKLYKRKSDLSGKKLISPYAPNSKNIVYDPKERWSDDFNPLNFGRDFDFSRSFFEQFNELYLDVPVNSRNVTLEENSDFTNNATGLKNCYLLQNSNYSEDCFYGIRVNYSKDCVDNYICVKSEKCYECVNIENCYDCLFVSDCSNCRNSILLDNCISCKDCYGCANLNNKQYFVNNKSSTKEEIEKLRGEFENADLQKRESLIKKEREFLAINPKRFAHVLKSENVTGDYISNSKDIYESFQINEGESLRYCHNIILSKDSIDYDIWGNNSSYVLDSEEVGENSRNIYYCRMIESCSNLFYCVGMYGNCHDCFGCAGLNHEEYCIFNKKYSREEYEKLAAKIVEYMKVSDEWGEYFPIQYAPFGYNESIAQDFFPLTKEEAEQLGARWQDEDFAPNYSGDYYQPKPIKEYESDQQRVDQALAGVLKCRTSNKPFKLQAGELAFYIKNNIQIPDLHPDQRHIERFKLTNPLKTWHRKCMCEQVDHGHSGPCPVELETTYSPDRSEKVYCEDCYQKEVI